MMARKKAEDVIDYSWVSDHWRTELMNRAQMAQKVMRTVADSLEADDVIGFYMYLTALNAVVWSMMDGANRGIKSAGSRDKETEMKRVWLKALGR